MFNGLSGKIGIERLLVPIFTKIDTILIIAMFTKPLPNITVVTYVMKIIISLKDPMVFEYPMIAFTNVGSKH